MKQLTISDKILIGYSIVVGIIYAIAKTLQTVQNF